MSGATRGRDDNYKKNIKKILQQMSMTHGVVVDMAEDGPVIPV